MNTYEDLRMSGSYAQVHTQFFDPGRLFAHLQGIRALRLPERIVYRLEFSCGHTFTLDLHDRVYRYASSLCHQDFTDKPNSSYTPSDVPTVDVDCTRNECSTCLAAYFNRPSSATQEAPDPTTHRPSNARAVDMVEGAASWLLTTEIGGQIRQALHLRFPSTIGQTSSSAQGAEQHTPETPTRVLGIMPNLSGPSIDGTRTLQALDQIGLDLQDMDRQNWRREAHAAGRLEPLPSYQDFRAEQMKRLDPTGLLPQYQHTTAATAQPSIRLDQMSRSGQRELRQRPLPFYLRLQRLLTRSSSN